MSSRTPRPGTVSWVSDLPAALSHWEPFADALVLRLNRLAADGPVTFSILVHGGPGSGKTSLLRLLQAKLSSAWLTVEVHVRHEERAGRKPAFALLQALRQSLAERHALRAQARLRFADGFAWLRLAGVTYVVALSILVIAAIGVVATVRPTLSLSGIGDTAATISSLAGAGAVVWGGAKLLARALIPKKTMAASGAPSTAAQYEQATAQELLDNRYRSLLRVAGRPVAFLIDDLEKSEAAYVVELLDSVLALIREAPPDTGPLTVLVLVVGDREWIKESLETVHKGPKYGVAAGRSSAEVRIGELFDLIVPVPSPTVALQRERLARALDEGGLPASREALQASLREASSEAEVLRFLRKAVPPAPEQEEPAFGPSSREGQDATANGLQRFLELLPPVPRERRRFVNQYVTELSLHIVEDRVVPAEALARWIILGIRWPALTRFLSSFPDAVQYFGADNLPAEIPEELRPLFRSQSVEQVVKSPDAPLTPELIRDLALL